MSRTAFVLSGGASLGAVQVGGLAALLEAGVTPDLIVGCSAGAVNGGRLAGRAGRTDVVATDVLSGDDVLLTDGDAFDAILASTAIPGVFPPVTIGGRELMDGGVVNNTPISHAVAMGAEVVWVLPTAHCFSRPAAPTTALGMALNALTLALNHRLAADVQRYRGLVDLRVAPPLCNLSVSPADFGHADELIACAHARTRMWLTGSIRSWSSATVRP